MNPVEALRTPDGRYIVVRGRLWRATNPSLDPQIRQHLVDQLMKARRAVAAALKTNHAGDLKEARQRVDEAKRGLGERGPVWWTDGEPDLNKHMVRTTLYADWYALVEKTL
ncbi:hypothetical protein RD110_21935 [Rhodoferax koreense]|uniref:Uncharacterized protein n=1 Tax=Rhodoferax koreensis TaxID=1842727 RepID=A0A1P8K0N0_9BURK|nr:hypothetical protein [Rhodoferax koreense]APW39545.1 hypothetical protein RD110_21935 [Rhodoferax koreense]